jgi:hypothetical protein
LADVTIVHSATKAKFDEETLVDIGCPAEAAIDLIHSIANADGSAKIYARLEDRFLPCHRIAARQRIEVNRGGGKDTRFMGITAIDRSAYSETQFVEDLIGGGGTVVKRGT